MMFVPPITRSATGQKALLLAVFFALLFASLGIGLVWTASRPGSSYFENLALILALIAAIVLFRAVLNKSSKSDFFSPIFCFGLAYLTWYAIGSIDVPGVPSTFAMGAFDPMPPGLWIHYLAGLAFYFLGVRIVPHYQASWIDFSKHPKIVDTWRSQYFHGVIFGLLVLLLLSYLAITAVIGIPILDPLALEKKLEIEKLGPTQLVFLTAGWTILALLTVRLCLATDRRLRRIYWLLAGLVTLLLASLGGRTNIFMPAIVVLVLVHYLGRRLDLKRLLVYGLCLFLAMSLYGYVRDVSYSGTESMESLQQIGLSPQLAPPLYAYLYIRYPVATYRDLTEIIPSQIPYQWGSVTLAPFRTFLPGDQQMADSFYKTILQSNFPGGGQPAGIIASFYCDFGLAGILLGMFLLGTLVAVAYRSMRRSNSVLSIMIYAWIMQSLLFGLFTGPFPYITTLWVPFFWWVLDWVMRHPPPSLRPAQA